MISGIVILTTNLKKYHVISSSAKIIDRNHVGSPKVLIADYYVDHHRYRTYSRQ